jgi:hypothetical protein
MANAASRTARYHRNLGGLHTTDPPQGEVASEIYPQPRRRFSIARLAPAGHADIGRANTSAYIGAGVNVAGTSGPWANVTGTNSSRTDIARSVVA